MTILARWFQPILKNVDVKLDHFPMAQGKNKHIFETTELET